MNRSEFNVWLKDYSAAFPDTAAWLNNSQDSKVTLGYWFSALEHTDLPDAKEATRRMVVGDEPAIPAYERETIPRVVAQIAKRVKSGRRMVKRDEPLLPDYGGPKWSLAGALKTLRERGGSIKDAMATLIDLIPADRNPPRYKCLRCLDSGIVLVWSNETIHAVMNGAENVPRKRCSLRCDCENGKRWSETFQVYDESGYCLFSGYDCLHEVESWCEVYKQMKLQRMPNYEPRFDAWAT
jgi:hypothetical protein